MKIAIIGAGNMGGSIARGLAKGSLIDDSGCGFLLCTGKATD